MPLNISHHMIHHPNVNPEEFVHPATFGPAILTARIPFPTVVLPGGGRLGIFPAVSTRYPGPNVGCGPGVSFRTSTPVGLT